MGVHTVGEWQIPNRGRQWAMTQLQSGYQGPVFSRIQAQAQAVQTWATQPASAELTRQAGRAGLAWGFLFFIAGQASAGTVVSAPLLLIAMMALFAAAFLDLGQGMRAAIWNAVAHALYALVLAFLGVVLTCGLLS